MPKSPSFFEHSDWLEHDSVAVYSGHHGQPMDRAGQVVRAYADKFVWEFPQQRVLFFCDLHADAEAFRRSLIACGAIACLSTDLLDFELTSSGREADIIIAGDIFDKGPSNLNVLEMLNQLRSQGANLKILAGNHDLRIWLTLNALAGADPEQIDYLATHLERAYLLVSEVLQRTPILSPTPDLRGKKFKSAGKKASSKKIFRQLFFPEIDEETACCTDTCGERSFEGRKSWLMERWAEIETYYKDRGIEPADLHRGLVIAKQLVVDESGPYSWIFREMTLLTRYGSFLLAHGGADDELCEMIALRGLDAVNERFRELLVHAKPTDLTSGAFGNCTLTKYRPIDNSLTSTGVRRLHGEQIYAIVHGHDNQVGKQNIAYRQELLHFQCDASLNRCTRELQGLSGKGMAVVVFEPEGKLTALSNEWPKGKSFTPSRSKTASIGLFKTILRSLSR